MFKRKNPPCVTNTKQKKAGKGVIFESNAHHNDGGGNLWTSLFFSQKIGKCFKGKIYPSWPFWPKCGSNEPKMALNRANMEDKLKKNRLRQKDFWPTLPKTGGRGLWASPILGLVGGGTFLPRGKQMPWGKNCLWLGMCVPPLEWGWGELFFGVQ